MSLKNLSDYEQAILSPNASKAWLRKELLERMRVNVGLITENADLKRKLQLCEERQPILVKETVEATIEVAKDAAVEAAVDAVKDHFKGQSR